jgi:hypothetical protein
VQPWIEHELRTVNLPDERLNKRYRLLLDRLSDKPTLSIPAACNGWTEIQSAYRFFDNERVEPAQLLQPHLDATIERIRQHPVVLIPQDTTEFDLTRKREKIGGPLSDENHWGLRDHVSLAVTPERLALGVVQSFTWHRDLDDFHKRSEARFKPIEEKESHRWLEGYRRAAAIAAKTPETKIISISDSEGDVYECFVEPAQREGVKAEWIVRACQNRSLTNHTAGKLRETVAAGPVLGTRTIEVSARPDKSHGDGGKRRQARSARTTTVTVQACSVTLQAPWRSADAPKMPDLTINAVLVREVNPPDGEPAIEWLLLTSLPIGTLAQIENIIHYYTCRWEIEVFFRVLKSGCTVQELQLETAARFVNCLSLYLIVAWRVLFVMRLGRECPEMPCEAVFTPAEWQSVFQIVQRRPATAMPSLGTMVIMIAELGGYINRKHDGPPGPQTLWIGMQRTRDFALAWSVFAATQAPP